MQNQTSGFATWEHQSRENPAILGIEITNVFRLKAEEKLTFDMTSTFSEQGEEIRQRKNVHICILYIINLSFLYLLGEKQMSNMMFVRNESFSWNAGRTTVLNRDETRRKETNHGMSNIMEI